MSNVASPTSVPPIPAPPSAEVQAALDASHLQLLEIGFYISGVLTALRFLWFLFFAGFMLVIGLTTALNQPHHATNFNDGPPPVWFFIFMGLGFGFFILMTLVFAGLEIYAGRCLKRRENPILIQIVAAFYCISIPWGTALGVCTFMVLNRPSVKALFSR